MNNEDPFMFKLLVAWVVSEHVSRYPKCQDLFAQHNILRFLVSILHLNLFKRIENMQLLAISQYCWIGCRLVWQVLLQYMMLLPTSTKPKAMKCSYSSKLSTLFIKLR